MKMIFETEQESLPAADHMAERLYGAAHPECFYRVHVNGHQYLGCDPEVYFKTLKSAYEWIVFRAEGKADVWRVEDCPLYDESQPPEFESIRAIREDAEVPVHILAHYKEDSPEFWRLDVKINSEYFTVVSNVK